MRIGTLRTEYVSKSLTLYSAQFSDWVRIGTDMYDDDELIVDDSAQFSDWVRIGTGLYLR